MLYAFAPRLPCFIASRPGYVGLPIQETRIVMNFARGTRIVAAFRRSLRFPAFRLPVSPTGRGRLQRPLRFPTLRLPVSATGGGRLRCQTRLRDFHGKLAWLRKRSLRFPALRLPLFRHRRRQASALRLPSSLRIILVIPAPRPCSRWKPAWRSAPDSPSSRLAAGRPTSRASRRGSRRRP